MNIDAQDRRVSGYGITTAVDRICTLTKRKKIIQGGTWAGKTAAIVGIIATVAVDQPNSDITVVAESIPALKKGAMKDFIWMMEQTQPRFFQDRWNATDRVYKFKNGSTVQFDSFESVSKAKAAGKRTHLFINEANHIPFPIADALMMRTSEDIWIDFNPDNEFWVHTELIGNDDVDFIILNYKDNEALPLSILQDLMQKQEKAKASKYWENWCKVYIDGEVGQLEGVVFENWEIIDKIPDGARMEAFGIDFGYTNDPSTGVGYWKWNGKRIFDEMFYETGLSNGNIADLLKENKISRIQYGVADSAEPKSIDEINRRGFTIKGSTKGKDSINFGIGLLQEEKFYVTARSVNMIKELRKYRWDTDREGNKLNRPIDAFNHCIDPMRYIAVEKFGKPTKHTRIIV